jgi:hypothetical protein
VPVSCFGFKDLLWAKLKKKKKKKKIYLNFNLILGLDYHYLPNTD